MKKNIIDNIFEIISKGTAKGIGQLYTEDDSYENTVITFGKKKHVNFGSYSYLNLEHDQRLKNGAIDAIQKYGIQFPSSRTYVSTTLYKEVENLLTQIFKNPVVLATTTTLAHIATMPVILEDGDVIIMDQQVHSSVQFMVRNMKQYGIPFHVVRHNNLEQLEAKIVSLSKDYQRIWYMCDGVYSMYGDTAPILELEKLLNKYKKFYLYADDAHGMSWAGDNGAGYVLSKMELHQRMILVTSLNKAFAAGGSVIITSEQNLADRIKTCGGPLIFAGQHQMSSLGASLACAKIHLSNEIIIRQKELKKKIEFCHENLLANNLPVISDGKTPIFFVGVGLPRVGYTLVKKMMEKGYYLNLAIFPAVSETCTGIRFTIIQSHKYTQISKMTKDLAVIFREALLEENRTIIDIHKAFRKVKKFKIEEPKPIVNLTDDYHFEQFDSITKISQKDWNEKLGHSTVLDWNNLVEMESIFKNNEISNNWCFHYFTIRDDKNDLIFATYMTECLTKDDALSPASISLQVEEQRKIEKHYLCSKTLMMGCPLSIGKHYYLSENYDSKQILEFFCNRLEKYLENIDVTVLNLRDFDVNNKNVANTFVNNGFIKHEMQPNYRLVFENYDRHLKSYLNGLRSDKRRFVTNRCINKEKNFVISTAQNKDNVDNLYQLYKNVNNRSFELNLFSYPKKLIEYAISNNDWDVFSIALKSKEDTPIAMACSIINKGHYHFLIAGLNYNYVENFDSYNQLLWQIVKRAKSKNCSIIDFGLTTGQNKRKFGCVEIKTNNFIQLFDNFNATIINQLVEGIEKENLKRIRNYSNEEVLQ